MVRDSAAKGVVDVPIMPSRQRIQEIPALASREIPLSPGASSGSSATEPNTGLYATVRMVFGLRQRAGGLESPPGEGNGDRGIDGGSCDADDEVGVAEQSSEQGVGGE